MKQPPRLINAAIATLFLLLTAATAAHGATYTVTNTQDSGAGSLRDAINQANATTEADTIEFQIPASGAGCANGVCTITLASGELAISSNLTINGPGASLLTINGNDRSRVFNISSSEGNLSSFIVNISGLTISHGKASGVYPGYAGGGIIFYSNLYNPGALYLDGVIISNNSSSDGGGIYNRYGHITVANSVISGNGSDSYGSDGGGISNHQGRLRVTSSTITGNKVSDSGGAIESYYETDVIINNSTISNNVASRDGSSIDNGFGSVIINNCTISGNGLSSESNISNYNGTTIINSTTISGNDGGIFTSHGPLSISKSTISGNGAGIGSFDATITLTSSTLSGNKSGIGSIAGTVVINSSTIYGNDLGVSDGDYSSLQINNSIIAGNGSDVVGKVQSGGYNLIGAAYSKGWVSTDKLNIDPLLGPLQDNGGPTFTHALLPGSPALDAGDNCVILTDLCNLSHMLQLTDQRGQPRRSGNAVDIGAYELQTAGNPLDEAQFFVRQHYLDFLSREPDAAGLSYWTSQITQCGADAACVNRKRVDVSAAFFISDEFQQTGSFVYRLYKAAYGARPSYAQFTSDRAKVVGGGDLEAGKSALADEFVTRAEFKTAYPDSLSNADFVNKLFDTANLRPYVAERQARIVALTLHTETRAQVLRDVAEFAEFRQREYNPSFVLMQYFGYLKRDADEAGYEFWLNVLNDNGANNYRGMVCSFITSEEYQKRFSPIVTHSNAECSQ